MAAPKKCPDELRERATRMAVEARRDPATRSEALAGARRSPSTSRCAGTRTTRRRGRAAMKDPPPRPARVGALARRTPTRRARCQTPSRPVRSRPAAPRHAAPCRTRSWCTGQYTSIAFTERLAAAGAAPSVGTVGDALDNALAESQIGLFKTELIRRHGPWKNVDDVELATLEGVDWHNNRRLHTACHDLTPVEYEQVFCGQHPAQRTAGASTP
jgi:hypothetical protein